MNTSSAVIDVCAWCGRSHSGLGRCPEVKALEYYPDGAIKRVEFYTPNDNYPPMVGYGGSLYPPLNPTPHRSTGMTEANEMVRRVADALAQSFKDTVAESAGKAFEETGVTLPNAMTWERYARAAIEAMREPTEAMCVAGIEAVADEAMTVIEWLNVGPAEMSKGFTAMIDASLKD